MIKYEDTAVKWMLYPAIGFLAFFMLAGTFIAYNTFVFPDYFKGEYVHFGRLRPLHVNGILFLWLLSADVGLIYYMTQRLCGIPLWNPTLAKWNCLLWWFTLVTAIFSFPFGTNWGWEYAEIPMWLGFLPLKFMFLLSVSLIGVNIFMTIANRKFEKMYVTLWYTMGALIWTTTAWILGSWGISFVPGGMSRVNVSFFYVHNLVGLIFTPMGLAVAYYFLPKLSGSPIYSHKLSLIGFWSIAFAYGWVGAHHIIHGPMSQWIQTVAIIFSGLLFVPVFTAVTNLFATLQHNWNAYLRIPAIRFIMMGVLFYLLVSVQGTFMALRNVNEITSKTDWIIGHAHMSLYGTFTFFAVAGIYGALPVLTGRPIYSARLADWHFTLNLLGAMMMFLSLHIGGFLQGLQWASWADGSTYAEYHSNLASLPFLQTVSDMRIWWSIRALSGLVILSGNLLFLINVFNTIMLEPRKAPPAIA